MSEQKKKSLGAEDIAAAEMVRDNVSLTDVRLHSSIVKAHENAELVYIEADRTEVEVKPQTMQNIRVHTTSPHKAGDAFIVFCLFGIRDVLQAPLDSLQMPEKEVVFQIEAEYKVIYTPRMKKGLTVQGKRTFGTLNTPYHVWSYWREFVANMTWRLGVPSITLDMLPPPRSLGSRKKPT